MTGHEDDAPDAARDRAAHRWERYDVPELPHGRRLLLKEHMMREINRDLPGSAEPAPAWRRWRLVAVPAAAAVLAVGGVVAVDTVDRFRHEEASAAAGVDQAAQLLARASAAALAEPVPDPRDGQFVYVKSQTRSGRVTDEGITLPPPTLREVWAPVSGPQNVVVHEDGKPFGAPPAQPSPVSEAKGPGAPDGPNPTPSTAGPTGKTPPANGETAASGAAAGDSLTAPSYAYLKTLPTDPDRLLALVRKVAADADKPRDDEAFVIFTDLLRENLLPPALRAAVYGAIAKLPGVTLIGDATDAAGRPGAAIGRDDGDTSMQLVFDKQTALLLGQREVQRRDAHGIAAGTVLTTSAVLAVAVVDEAGRPPAEPVPAAG
ncbi:CU044_5270 family protein [Yinghuangia seranimata]|uniref:CU044_5270 family protein n=1 Tax=Yinghuangia seranimata TaxID=408067 RepID=UPI00248C9F35|nr:CU044_5270 family protein [Yinghuangia seranimata]MDI2132818.1 CU044_5270 family protein [Yinghuangia seranimata]